MMVIKTAMERCFRAPQGGWIYVLLLFIVTMIRGCSGHLLGRSLGCYTLPASINRAPLRNTVKRGRWGGRPVSTEAHGSCRDGPQDGTLCVPTFPNSCPAPALCPYSPWLSQARSLWSENLAPNLCSPPRPSSRMAPHYCQAFPDFYRWICSPIPK